ncbi:MAG: Holliday junction resolvase RecU [Blautia sp.]
MEELINRTNEQYGRKLALIRRSPHPSPWRMDRTPTITLAYLSSAARWIISAQSGIPVCFDAKECKASTFPLANIHPHQVRFMEEFEQQGGISFLLIFFSQENQFYYLTFQRLREFWGRMEAGGRKSFTGQELDAEFYLLPRDGLMVPYLDGLQRDLELRD